MLAGNAAGGRSGRWIPWLFVAGFAVMLVANGIMITVALNTWTGLGTENPYEKGVNYNDSLTAARVQAARGWQHELKVERRAPQSARLVVALLDQNRQPVFADTVVASVVRPTHEGWDFEAQLDGKGAGRYSADIEFPLPGQWDVRVVAWRGAESYQAQQRVHID